MDQEEQVRTLREVYSPFLDPGQSGGEVVHEESTERSITDIRRNLRAKYEANPALQRIELRIAGVRVGVTTRGRVCRDVGTAGDTPVGEGDRASQPGDSTQYRVIEFECRSCDQRGAMSFYDERRIPVCAAHGAMELCR